ncbi:MAG: DUF6049 family protein, partial [Acidimicrobiales bacterium]
DALARAAAGAVVLRRPFVDLDVSAWLAAGLGDELDRQLREGDTALEAALGQRLTPRIWVADGPLSDAAVAWLESRGFDRLVIPTGALAEAAATNEARLFRLGAERPTLAAPLDLAISDRLAAEAGDEPVLASAHALAELALVHNTDPRRPRAAVLRLPPAPSPALLSALGEGLSGGPVRVVELTELFAAASPAPAAGEQGAPPVRRFAGAPPAPDLDYAARLAVARAHVESFVGAATDDPVAAALRRDVLSSGADTLDPAQRRALLDGVYDAIQQRLSVVEWEERHSVTLTSRQGSIPVTLLNRGERPLRARLGTESRQLKLASTAQELTLPPGPTDVELAVTAPGPGRYELRLSVTTPDGRLPLAADSVIDVRSTAISGVGLLLSAGAAVFLAVWWGRNIRASRRNRRLIDPAALPGQG